MLVARALLALLLSATAAGASAAASNSQLEARIEKLEYLLDSRGLLGLLEQVETLQREVRQLRGEVEVQTHTLEGVTGRQRELYLDIDNRLHRLEGGDQGEPASPSTPGSTGSAAARAPSATKPPAATSMPGSAEERKDYDHALSLLRDGRYSDASAAFQTFLQQYPQSGYADNARYWQGEVYYVTREFPLALEAFGEILSDYPDSNKISDALLKTGYIQYELKEWQNARASLNRVVKEFPGSTAARLAAERLERMKREGH